MDNYEAIAYACVALDQLQKDCLDIDKENLHSRMLYLMDMYSEKEIYKKYCGGI